MSHQRLKNSSLLALSSSLPIGAYGPSGVPLLSGTVTLKDVGKIFPHTPFEFSYPEII